MLRTSCNLRISRVSRTRKNVDTKERIQRGVNLNGILSKGRLRKIRCLQKKVFQVDRNWLRELLKSQP